MEHGNDGTRKTSVLVVEDESLIACDVQQILENGGYRVIGPAASVAHALALLEHETPDLALLDVKLAEGTSFALADALHARHCRVVFVTGHSRAWIAGAYANLRRLVEKPFLPDDLLTEIKGALAAPLDDHKLVFA